jgi:hypothetical protein
MNRILFHIMTALITFGISSSITSYWFLRPVPGATTISITSSITEKENVAEAVFRYQLEWNKQEKVAFLTLEGKEPDENFMNRFVGQTEPRVQRHSRKKFDRYDRIIDADTREQGELISVVSIRWICDTIAEVRSNVYDGDVGEYILRVHREGDHWIVKSFLDLSEAPWQ